MYDTIRKIIEQQITSSYTGSVPIYWDGTGRAEEAHTDFIRASLLSVESVDGTIGSVSEESMVGLYVIDIFTAKNKGIYTANQAAQQLIQALYLRHFSSAGVYLEVIKNRFSRQPSTGTFNQHQLIFTLAIRKVMVRPL